MKSYLLLHINSEEFKTILREVIQEEINKLPLMKEPPISNSAELLTTKEAAKLLGLSLPTIALYVRNGQIPALRIGARYRFDKKKILDSIQKIRIR